MSAAPRIEDCAEIVRWVYEDATADDVAAVGEIMSKVGSYLTVVPEEPPLESSSWAPVDVAAVLRGGNEDPPPCILARADGHALLYRGRVHGIHGEPEACKGWATLAAVAETLEAGGRVVYADFEDTAGNVLQRLLALGADPGAVVDRFRYVQPLEPAEDGDLDLLLAWQPTLVILDGATEAFANEGLSIADNDDVAKWLKRYPRRFARAGAATVVIDHVTKDRESRGRYAIGGQHKLAGVDVAYSLHVIHPFGRGREGLVRVKVEKDRPGHVRAHQDDTGTVALVKLTSHPDGAVIVHVAAPGERSRRPLAADRPHGPDQPRDRRRAGRADQARHPRSEGQERREGSRAPDPCRRGLRRRSARRSSASPPLAQAVQIGGSVTADRVPRPVPLCPRVPKPRGTRAPQTVPLCPRALLNGHGARRATHPPEAPSR